MRYTDNKDGTITDTKTGLMWQKETISKSFTWDEAIEYCDNLELAKHKDWRLPTIEELFSIVDYESLDPACNTMFGAVSANYWSSTTSAYGTASAWPVNFYRGSANPYGKSSNGRVRAIRTVKNYKDGASVSAIYFPNDEQCTSTPDRKFVYQCNEMDGHWVLALNDKGEEVERHNVRFLASIIWDKMDETAK